MCVLIHWRPKDWTFADKVLENVGIAETFPEIPCVSPILGGPLLRLGIPGLVFRQDLENVGKTLKEW